MKEILTPAIRWRYVDESHRQVWLNFPNYGRILKEKKTNAK